MTKKKGIKIPSYVLFRIAKGNWRKNPLNVFFIWRVKWLSDFSKIFSISLSLLRYYLWQSPYFLEYIVHLEWLLHYVSHIMYCFFTEWITSLGINIYLISVYLINTVFRNIPSSQLNIFKRKAITNGLADQTHLKYCFILLEFALFFSRVFKIISLH